MWLILAPSIPMTGNSYFCKSGVFFRPRDTDTREHGGGSTGTWRSSREGRNQLGDPLSSATRTVGNQSHKVAMWQLASRRHSSLTQRRPLQCSPLCLEPLGVLFSVFLSDKYHTQTDTDTQTHTCREQLWKLRLVLVISSDGLDWVCITAADVVPLLQQCTWEHLPLKSKHRLPGWRAHFSRNVSTERTTAQRQYPCFLRLR